MQLSELMGRILEILPDATFDEIEGEIVISTGMKCVDSDGTLVPTGD